MKKYFVFFYNVLFLVLCAVPGIMLFFTSSEEDTSENRRLAEKPELSDENGKFNRDWNTQVQAYVSDHFGFRRKLVEWDSALKAELFHVSAEEDVIIGKDEWLFYTPTLNDYLGRATVSELGLNNIIYNLELMQTYAESKDSYMLTAIVPNKNTIYPMYMPDYERNFGTDGNLNQLQSLLSNSNVHYVNLSEALKKEAESQNWALPIYYQRDTHWNAIGALIGYRTIMEHSGYPYQNFSEASYCIEKNHKGDLQNMLFPNSEVLDENAVYDIDFDFLYQGHHIDANDITINTVNSNGTGSLLMFRDSFGEAVIPYFSQNFKNVRYSRARPNPLYHLKNDHFDLVILEIVERNIAWLQKEAPVHSAVKADFVPEADEQGSAECFIDRETSPYIQFYGTVQLPENLKTAPEYIFTLTNSTGQVYAYQAYHCYEADKLNSSEILDNGWSLYISETELQQGEDYQIALIIPISNVCLSCPLGNIKI